ncbi:MAG: nicotinate-nucleotide--dimethylbenzimidazole phosphoribosyltransferase [Myxococcota bacterium]
MSSFRERALHRQGELTKPPGSLGRLEELAVHLAAIQKTDQPSARPAAVLVFASDHPVTRHGVSAYPASVTAAMVQNFVSGGAASTVMARALGLSVEVVDVGVQFPAGLRPKSRDEREDDSVGARFFQDPVTTTPVGDLRTEDAMAAPVFEAAVAAGRAAVDRLDPDVRMVLLGEMGIGNSTCAAAVACALLDGAAETFTGPGTGLDAQGLLRKRQVVDDAVSRYRMQKADRGPASTAADRGPASAFGTSSSSGGSEADDEPVATAAGDPEAARILRSLGGKDLAALAGAAVRAAETGRVVLVDGFIVTTAVVAALGWAPSARSHLLFAHRSQEPGHLHLLRHLDARPLLDLDLRLGEATGALSAFPLLDLACRLHNEMATFQEAQVAEKL